MARQRGQTWRWGAAVSAVGAFALLSLSARSPIEDTPAPDRVEAGIDFSRDIRPILSENCFKCHGPDDGARQASLRLDSFAGATALRSDRDGAAIVVGDPSRSILLDRVRSDDLTHRMPPPETGKRLTPKQIALLERWIESGAEYTQHWSFLAPQRPPLPVIADGAWVRSEIDRFILGRLRSEGLEPSPEADRSMLLRRVSLDLIGLPPTPQEVEAFVNDESADAFEKVVDRLLASPHFGEHWARWWLDMARYADSQGFEKDRPRTMWRYRDWVIDALNADMPFDQFTAEQIAGDMLAAPALEQVIATGFHRNTQTNTEGGTDNEEFRAAAVIDRVNTTMQVWMGLTMNCVQCHSHKYDPIAHQEFYRLYAFFNQTADADLDDDAPRIAAPTAQQQRELARLNAAIAAVEEQLINPDEELAAKQAAWEASLSESAPRWTVLQPLEAAAAHGTTLSILEDGSILAEGANPPTNEYTIRVRSDLDAITAVRIEAIADDRLPNHGPGRVAHGNFVLNEIDVVAEPEGDFDDREAPEARFVRIELPGEQRILSLAEVHIFSGETDLAPGATVSQSSVAFNGPAALAIDGNTDGRYEAMSITHTAQETSPWWEADLGAAHAIDRIVLFNRLDATLHTRLGGAHITLLDPDRNVIRRSRLAEATREPMEIATRGPISLPFTRAAATFEQSEFPAFSAIDGDASPRSGWAIHPSYSRDQIVVFEASPDIGRSARGGLTITLKQTFGGEHTLGRFRISITDATAPLRLIPQSIQELLATPRDERSRAQRLALARYMIETSPHASEIGHELAQLQQQRAQLEAAIPMALVMRELAPDERRETLLFLGGSFLTPDRARGTLLPGVPAVLHEFPADAPRDRRGLAMWLTHRDNPLTARVQVNRIWAELFGAGIVETLEDFGFQGSYPTHPELLDWLAVRWQDDFGWSLKDLLREIVTSATYRQTSRTTPELLELDPQNRLLARGPRFRLSAEQLRDQALFVAGLLDLDRIGGPSVLPYLPEGMLPQAFDDYVQQASSGEDRYRRGLYTAWRRTGHYPSFATFDAPSREVCSIERPRTNTPLQALVMLNDPVYVEAAQAFARRLISECGDDFQMRITDAFNLALARDPSAEEVAIMRSLYDDAIAMYDDHEDDAILLATDPLGSLPQSMNATDAAAMTVICNVILNLDEMMIRP